MSTPPVRTEGPQLVAVPTVAPPHPEERARLRSLKNLKLLDSEPIPFLDRLTELASHVFQTEIAAISLVDVDRQWFLARFGLEQPETGRSESLCSHAIHADTVFVIENAAEHPTFRDNPLVVGEPHIRSYAGAIIRDASSLPLGTFCVIGKSPRSFSEHERSMLVEFGRVARKELLELSQRHQSNDEGRRDAVTGALQGDSFFKSAKRLSVALGDQHGASVIAAVTIDNLSFLADTQGGAATDQILRELCERIKACVEGYGLTIMGRPDGKRIVSKTITNAPVDHYYLDRVRCDLVNALSRGFETPNGRVQPQLTIAVNQRTTELELTDAVNMCRMASARAQGSGDVRSIVVDAAIEAESRQRIQVEAELPQALRDDHFHLVAQPKFDAFTSELTGFEILLRWSHPELGEVRPDDVFRAARSTYRIPTVDRWVIRNACETAKQWLDQSLEFGRMSINLCGETLLDPNFLDWFKGELRTSGAPAWAFDFEIVESSLFSNLDAAIAALNQLAELGVTFSLDDFGTGYSSLSYLRRLPINHLKIDKSFVDEIERDSSAAAMCAGIIGLAHELGMTVIAEGVETELQIVALRALRCDQVQGFLRAKPMQLQEAEALIKDHMPG